MSRAVRGSIDSEGGDGGGVVRTPSPPGAVRGIAPPAKLQLLSENCAASPTSSSCAGAVSPAVVAFSSSSASDAGGHGEGSGGVVSVGDNSASGGGIPSAVSLLSSAMVANMSSSASSSGRRTSRVWCYFTMIDNYHYACTLCQFIGTYTNTTNMRKHIQHHHPERYQDILDHTRPTVRPNSLQYYMLDQHQQSMAPDVTVLNDMSSHYRPAAVSERGLSSAGYGGYMPNQHHHHTAFNSSVTFEPVAAKNSSDHKHSMEAQYNRYQHTFPNSSSVQNVSAVLHQQQSPSGQQQHHLYGTARPNDSLDGSQHVKKLEYSTMPRPNIPPSSSADIRGADDRGQPPEYARQHGSYANSELRSSCDADKQLGHCSSARLLSNNNNDGNSGGEEMAGLRELKIEPDDSADSDTPQRPVSESESDIMNANQGTTNIAVTCSVAN